jgi:hypothetical protein
MKSFLFFLFSISLTFVHAQSTWYDATALKYRSLYSLDDKVVVIHLETSDDLIQLIEAYCPSGDGTAAGLMDCYEDNPFIRVHITEPENIDEEGISAVRDIGNAMMPPGGSMVTNAADGLARFLVKRTKEELTAAFFTRFQEAITDNVYLGTIFPNTRDLLSTIAEDIYQYQTFIESLRHNFIIDMEALDANLPATLDLLAQDQVLQPGLAALLQDGFHTAYQLQNGGSPVDMLSFLGGDALMQDPALFTDTTAFDLQVKDIAAAFKLLNLLSTSLKSDGENESYWVDILTLKAEIKDPVTAGLFLGLLYQQSGQIVFHGNTDMKSVFKSIKSHTDQAAGFMQLIADFSTLANEMYRTSWSTMPIPGAEVTTYQVYYPHIEKFLQITGLTDQVIQIVGQIKSEKAPLINTFNQLFKNVNQLNLDLVQNQYVAAISDVAILLDLVLKDKFTFKKDFLAYGQFIATIAAANDPDAVAEAIEMFALPPGSSRMKKYSQMSVALNAYGGGGYGWENLSDPVLNAGISNKGVIAPSAPVGVNFNVGFGEAGSLSLFMPVIDIGAIYVYRFSDQTQPLPVFDFKNILAPGAYIIYGAGKDIPLSAGFGAQLGPNLRKVTTSGLQVSETSAWRFGFILNVDIPILHLYTK